MEKTTGVAYSEKRLNREKARIKKMLSLQKRNIEESRKSGYKGGRVLPYSIRFRYWRETEGISITKMAERLSNKTREFSVTSEELVRKLQELQLGRYKPPTWLILLLIDTYRIKFPWFEFWDGCKESL